MKNILCICRPITSEDCGKFLGKVTREKQVRGKKNYPSINKLSLDFFYSSSVIYVYILKHVLAINYVNN